MSFALFNRPTSAKNAAAQKGVRGDTLSFLTTLRLMLPKLGVAYLFVMLLSVYNRIMINELKIGATIVGLLYFGYNLMNILQVSSGRLADRRAFLGFRRTPLMIAGLLLAAVSLIPLPYVAPMYAHGQSWALGLMLLCMMGFGLGFAANGDSQNTLIAELTEGKRNRAGVVSAVWLFQLVCIVGSGITISILLRSAEIAAGIAADCTTAACATGRSHIALEMMPNLFLVGPIISLIGLLPILGLEKRVSKEDLAKAQARPALNLKQAYTSIFSNTQTRLFFFFIFAAIFGLFLQDDILEPFGADVFHLAPSQTARFQSLMGGATIVAMLIVGFVAGRWAIPKRHIAHVGALTSATGFGLLVISTMTHSSAIMYAGMVVLGFGMGVFNIGALSMMMDMTVPGEVGSLMGAWGMSQALANGLSQFVGGSMRDLGIHLLGEPSRAYGIIFATSVALCIIAVNLMTHVDVQKFRRMTREQLGMTLAEA